MSTNLAVHFSSERDDWQTPNDILDAVREVFVTIECDPCTVGNNPTCAQDYYTAGEDGLSREWKGDVFMNPPYGRGVIGQWIDKAIEQYRISNATSVIALLPARPGSKWFRPLWDTADAMCFWHNRVRFMGAESGAPFPSVAVYWGPHVRLFGCAFSRFGKVIRL